MDPPAVPSPAVLVVSDISPWFLRVVAFLFGAAWGSFFNVAVYRWPRDMSVVTPPSHCPHCGKPVQAWRNVPIFGYLFLKGRAACCGTPLTPRYAVVETLTAVLCVAVLEHVVLHGDANRFLLHALIESLVYFAFVGGLVIATFVDLEWMEIPDEVSLPGTALGLVTAPFRAFPGVDAAALGAGAGFLIIQVLFVWCYERIAGRRGMGEGDSKFLMMIGAFLGWKGALFALVGGAMQGLVVAGILLATGRSLMPDIPYREGDELPPTPPVPPAEAGATPSPTAAAEDAQPAAVADTSARELPADATIPEGPAPAAAPETATLHGEDSALKMPYGPFLALGALEYFFFGDRILDVYFSLIGG